MGPQLLSVQKHLLYEEGHTAPVIFTCHILIVLSKKKFIQWVQSDLMSMKAAVNPEKWELATCRSGDGVEMKWSARDHFFFGNIQMDEKAS